MKRKKKNDSIRATGRELGRENESGKGLKQNNNNNENENEFQYSLSIKSTQFGRRA